jgi:hypothetical protein
MPSATTVPAAAPSKATLGIMIGVAAASLVVGIIIAIVIMKLVL